MTSAILMQQLDYWFVRKPQGFYKYSEPPKTESKTYRTGDSWTEELGFSMEELQCAFKNIGVAYKSKSDFKDAVKEGTTFINSEGEECFYARYYDRGSGNSFYYRNDVLMDSVLDMLVRETDNAGLRETDNLGFPITPETDIPVLPETDNVGLHNTKNTSSEITITKNTSPAASATDESLEKTKGFNQPLSMTKEDVLVSILEIVSEIPDADMKSNVPNTKSKAKDKLWTKRDGAYFALINKAFDILTAKGIDWRREGKHCRELVTLIREGQYTLEQVIYCVAWAYKVGKFDFFTMSTLSVPKLMPQFLDLYRTGKLQESLDMKPKYETSGQRTERIYTERENETDKQRQERAKFAKDYAERTGVRKPARI